MKNLFTAAIIAITATAAHADRASNFAECVIGQIAIESGITLEIARLAMPDDTRQAEADAAHMARTYFELPSEYKSLGQAMMLSQIPQAEPCLNILER